MHGVLHCSLALCHSILERCKSAFTLWKVAAEALIPLHKHNKHRKRLYISLTLGLVGPHRDTNKVVQAVDMSTSSPCRTAWQPFPLDDSWALTILPIADLNPETLPLDTICHKKHHKSDPDQFGLENAVKRCLRRQLVFYTIRKQTRADQSLIWSAWCGWNDVKLHLGLERDICSLIELS